MRRIFVPALVLPMLLSLILGACGGGGGGESNKAPAADDLSISLDEDTSVAFSLNASDPEGDSLTWEIVNGPSHGVVTGTLPDITYTPNADYNGSDSCTFNVNDGSADSNIATVEITVNPVNDPPTSTGATIATDEDVTSAGVEPWVIDVDTIDAHTYSILTQPTNGVVTIISNQLVYDPKTDFNGGDSFTFRTRDSGGEHIDGIANVSVAPVNDPPISTSTSITTNEDTTSIGVTPSVIDVDIGDIFIFTIVTQPTSGTAYVQSNQLYYSPDPDINGMDSFTFRTTDGNGGYIDGSASVTVIAQNDLPVAYPQSVFGNEDISIGIALAASDVENNPLTWEITSVPQHGTLSGVLPNLSYQPASNYNGSDSFDFKVNDGAGDSNVATVQISVNAVNDPPTADSYDISLSEDTTIPIPLTADDIDGDSLTWILDNPSSGSISGTAPHIMYSPNPDYFGNDSFTYYVNDGSADSNVATIQLTISNINDAPNAHSQSMTIDEDQSPNITVIADDIENDSLSWFVVTPPQHGSLAGALPDVIYQPDLNYNGSDSFSCKANDGSDDSNLATIEITLNAVNDAPVASTKSLILNEDTTVPITLTASDVEGDSLTWVVGNLSHGSISGIAPNLWYTPSSDYFGSDSFDFYVNDGNLDSNTVMVELTVNKVNDAPNSYAQTLSTDEDDSLNITLAADDIDGDTLSWIIENSPQFGTIVGTLPDIMYIPDLDYHGSDNFSFKVNDGLVDSNISSVDITINAVPDTWHVDIDASGTDDGHSWTNAFNHPQDALDAAEAGDKVWVAEGVYVRRTPIDSQVIAMLSGVELYGGFVGTETSLSERNWTIYSTIIDGENQAIAVLGADAARLDGFEITNGTMSVLVENGDTVEVENCNFYSNGQFRIDYAAARIQNCNFYDYWMDHGLMIINSGQTEITNCTFSNFQPPGGYPIYMNNNFGMTVLIKESTFSNNSITPLFIEGDIHIQDCLFTNNTYSGDGGAIRISGSGQPVDVTIENTLIASNACSGSGGAIFNQASSPIIKNCTIVNNSADVYGGGIVNQVPLGTTLYAPRIENSILWDNSDVQVYDDAYNSTQVIYSNVQGGFSGTANINLEPSFMDTTNGDYRLRSDSPSIDTGDNSSVTSSYDLTGDPRIADGDDDALSVVDMGAYERQDRIWFVDVASSTGTPDGTSWISAFTHPQDAMDVASPGDQVWVAGGTYVRRTQSDTVVLTVSEGLGVYGGFEGTEAQLFQRDPESYRVMLDGENEAYHVVDMSSANDSVLDGFTITGGIAPMSIDRSGGGIYIYTSDNVSMTINNCIIDNNQSVLGGGGAFVSVGPTGHVLFSECLFSGNYEIEWGGGALSIETGNVTITSSQITSNTSYWSGGGISNAGHLEIYNSLIASNHAGDYGPGAGAGIYTSGETLIVNTTIVNNSTWDSGGGISVSTDEVEIKNSIIWGNIPDQIDTGSYLPPAVTYSDVQGGYTGTGNINVNPQFIDGTNGDYRFLGNSPCIDTGNNMAVPLSINTDLDGNSRFIDGDGQNSVEVDMGAYEYQP